MYKCTNGWTKEKMLEVIRARNSTKRSTTKVPKDGQNFCLYLSNDGNKCGVGLFIPDGHESQKQLCSVVELVRTYPDLTNKFPLDMDGMSFLQFTHDSSLPHQDVRQIILDWVGENVE